MRTKLPWLVAGVAVLVVVGLLVARPDHRDQRLRAEVGGAHEVEALHLVFGIHLVEELCELTFQEGPQMRVAGAQKRFAGSAEDGACGAVDAWARWVACKVARQA